MTLQTSFDDFTMDDIEDLTPDQLKAAISLISANEIELWSPLPGPQTMAYESKADIIGYGGAAGGGKTDFILGKCINQHRKALVVRLNGTEHTAFVDRLEEVLGDRTGYSGKDGIWRNAGPRKVQIELGSVPKPGDEKKYRGRPHDLKVFDEAAEIPEAQVRFLMGWMRTTIPGQICQTVLCFNPPTSAEGRWVVDFFAPWLDPKHINPAQPGELRWFATLDGKDTEVADGTPFVHNGEQITPQSRTFIPARVTDNPYLVGTGYMSTLQALPEPLRSQMLYGDFNAGTEDDPWQVIPTKWVEIAQERWKKPPVIPPMDSLGIDVARGGKDNTLIARRHGTWFDEPLVYPGTETPNGPTVAGLTIAATRDSAPQHIDVIGVGSSPYDFLNQANQQVLGINVAEGSVGRDKSGRLGFTNLRSELIWKLREALDPEANNDIQLPPDRQILLDLTAPKWRPVGAKIQVESREEIIKRIHRSPDYLSAYVLANIDTPKRKEIFGVSNSNRMSYDPYSTRAISTQQVSSQEYDPYSNITGSN